MLLSPLAVVLLAQLGILLLGIIGYQKLQKKRLIKELQNLRGTSAGRQSPELGLADADFDVQQAELLLNRSLQGLNDIAAEAPVVKKQCQDQQALIVALADCLSIPLAQSQEAPTAKPKATATVAAAGATTAAMAADTEAWSVDDILSQEVLDETLMADDADDDFGLGDLDSLETSNEAEDDELSLPGEDPEMPEDTLQATLDNLDDFDFSDLEEELLKDDSDKPKK